MNIYQHFRPSEREFIDQVLQWKSVAEEYFQPKLTDFLDPREQLIVQSIVGSNGEVQVEFFGAFPLAERKRAILRPSFIPVQTDDFNIQLFEVEYASKFVTITHPQVLGSLMSLGVRRSKFGDIVAVKERIQMVVAKEIADFISLELKNIGRNSIQLIELPLEAAFHPQEEWQLMNTTVSSLRLDTFIAAVYRLSRQRAQELIKHGLVKVNWTAVEDTSFEIEVADVVSVRGHGRAKMIEIDGKTKKDKWKITVGKVK